MPGEIRHQLSSCWLSFQMASFDDSRKLVLKICEKVQQPAGQEQTGLYKDSIYVTESMEYTRNLKQIYQC